MLCPLVAVIVVLLVGGQVEGRRQMRGRGGSREPDWKLNIQADLWYQEGRLTRTVLHQPYLQTRPVLNGSVPIHIEHGIKLIAISDVVPSRMYPIVTFRTQIRQVWTDSRLMWKSTVIGNIRHLHVRSEEIWTPETEVLSSLDDVDYLSHDKHDVLVTSSGIVTWTYGATYRLPCTSLPDETSIRCQFRAWTPNYDADEINLVPTSGVINLTNYATTVAGEVQDSSVKQELVIQTPDVGPHSTLLYEFTFTI